MYTTASLAFQIFKTGLTTFLAQLVSIFKSKVIEGS